MIDFAFIEKASSEIGSSKAHSRYLRYKILIRKFALLLYKTFQM